MREELHQNDAVWARFYRDGATLGEICSEFGCSVYQLSPWLTAPLVRAATGDALLPAHPEPDVGRVEDMQRAASALLDTLWQHCWSGGRTHEENWAEMDRRFPQARWLHNAIKPTPPSPPREEEHLGAAPTAVDPVDDKRGKRG